MTRIRICYSNRGFDIPTPLSFKMASNLRNRVVFEPLENSFSKFSFKHCFSSSNLDSFQLRAAPQSCAKILHACHWRLMIFPALQNNLSNLDIDNIERDRIRGIQDIKLNAYAALDFATLKIRLQVQVVVRRPHICWQTLPFLRSHC